ncbi:MAG: molecular chaperone TorD family protein [Alphaproteobacteria bacterium]|nr:molecular chaperone TorD family protein [Alphaproteobacteria bacterium]
MDAHDLALSRSRTWALLGRLLLEGPTPGVAAWVAAVPALADTLVASDDDARAARHHAILGSEVFPYASAFLSDDGLLGGDVAGAVRARFAAAGFSARVSGVEPDHAGMICLCLAFLGEMEVEALDDGRDDVLARVRALQADVLGADVLPWFPALAVALERQGDPFYATVGALAVELAAAHDAAPSPVILPPPLDVLDEPKAGLATVARALLVPGRSGWFLSRADLIRLGRAVEVPPGFGPRWKMLEALLVGAVDHGRAREALAALTAEIGTWDEGFAGWEALGLPVSPWRERLAVTKGALQRLSEAAQA